MGIRRIFLRIQSAFHGHFSRFFHGDLRSFTDRKLKVFTEGIFFSRKKKHYPPLSKNRKITYLHVFRREYVLRAQDIFRKGASEPRKVPTTIFWKIQFAIVNFSKFSVFSIGLYYYVFFYCAHHNYKVPVKLFKKVSVTSQKYPLQICTHLHSSQFWFHLQQDQKSKCIR